MASNRAYCVCRQPYDSTKFMIECDVCKEWFHGSCINISEHQSADIDKFHCPQCSATVGQSIAKIRRNWHRHDHTDPNASEKRVQTGTTQFVRELESRHFPSPDGVLKHLSGYQVTSEYFLQNGFKDPVLVDSIDGLDIITPPHTFTVFDIMNYIGEDYEIDVIDVNRQVDLKMTMREWVAYLTSSGRKKIFNVISLEFSETRMSKCVEPPRAVRDISWIHTLWPDALPPDCAYERPNVHKYCLMGTAESFTDFHIDFGGTSVWYHVLKGEKIFYMIKPTPANLSLYERWMASSNQMETFFGDLVDACYKMTVKEGQTFLIPTGWIHAVLTPTDSLVFGGNFLHSFNIPLQLHIYEMEKRIKTPEKFKFPLFQTTNWYAAKHVFDQIKVFNEESVTCPEYLLLGAKSLSSSLKAWTQEKDFIKRIEEIPECISYSRLLKDLAKEIRHVEKMSNANKPKVEREKRKSKRIRSGYSDTEDEKKQVAPLKLSISNHPVKKLKVSIKPKAEVLLLHEEDDKVSPLRLSVQQIPGNVQYTKEKIPEVENLNANFDEKMDDPYMQKDTSVFDFVDSDDGFSHLVVDEKPKSKAKSKSKQKKKATQNDLKSLEKKKPLKLKLSCKYGIRNGKSSEEQTEHKSDDPEQNLNSSIHNGTIEDILKASAYSNNNSGPNSQRTALSSVSASNKINNSGPNHQLTTKSIKSIISHNFSNDIQKSMVQNPSKIEVNNENSKSNDLGGRTSPSTSEAIQGMLSIGSSGFEFNSSGDNSTSVNGSNAPNTFSSDMDSSVSHTPPFASSVSYNFISKSAHRKTVERKSLLNHRQSSSRSKTKKYLNDDDFEAKMSRCPQDDDYIYPGLEFSDDDEDIIQKINHRRGDPKDSTWNPRAKVTFNCPKGERPIREGHKKEAIESGLAAAAAKLAHLPVIEIIVCLFQWKKPVPSRVKEPEPEPEPEPGTSSSYLKKQTNNEFKNSKKPKKGFATAKQRLGKILKIHKMLH
ncbi:Lysine-specific demethylase 7B [Nymphon striatum]|nr:Lysine-specific demethylase 7B [Nymphon striatum]